MRELKFAAIPADGIGKEVISTGLEVLDALAECDGGFRLAVESIDWGSDYYQQHGAMTPEDGREQLQHFDAIYFGAVGAPDAVTPVGTAPRHLPGVRPVCRHPADPDPSRHQQPARWHRPRGSRLGDRPREFRRRVGTFWTACLMLDHLGETDASIRLMRAVERVTANPSRHTPDLGGTATTRQVTDAVIRSIRAENPWPAGQRGRERWTADRTAPAPPAMATEKGGCPWHPPRSFSTCRVCRATYCPSKE